MKDKAKVNMILSVEQADVVREALDVYTRIMTGQFGIIGEMVRDGRVPVRRNDGEKRTIATADQSGGVAEQLNNAKNILGFATNESLGISHSDVHVSGRRSFEVLTELSHVLQKHGGNEVTGAYSEGLTLRYTDDDVPSVSIVDNPSVKPKRPQ